MGGVTIYERLGVSPAVTDEELRRAYLARVHELHPDRNDDPGARRELGLLNVDWRAVNQSDRRAAYDLRIESERRAAERLVRVQQQRAARAEQEEAWQAEDQRQRDAQAAFEEHQRRAEAERAAIEAAVEAARARTEASSPPPPPKKPHIDKETVRRGLDVAFDVLDAFFKGGKR